MSEPSEQVSIEALESQLCELAAHIDAAEGRFLALLGEFEARRGWETAFGLISCAHWLSWRCGLSLAAAREHVRVARALRSLPVIAALAASGELSYAKVRAITRVAKPASEAEMAELARYMTASQCERLVRCYRSVLAAGDGAAGDGAAGEDEAQRARRAHERRYLETYTDDDGSVVLRARLSPANGAMVLSALNAAAEADLARSWRQGPAPMPGPGAAGPDVPGPDVPAGTSPQDVPAGTSLGDGSAAPDARPDASQRRADALVELAEAWLAGVAPAPVQRPGSGEAGPSYEAGTDEAGTYEAGTYEAGPTGQPCSGGATVDPQPTEPVGADGPVGAGEPARPAAQPRAAHQLVIHVDAALLSDPGATGRCYAEGAGAIYAAELDRLACDTELLLAACRPNKSLLDVGRARRVIPARLRWAVRLRDQGRCRFPGCTNTHVDGHHVIAWSQGGRTDLSNILSLCRRHPRRGPSDTLAGVIDSLIEASVPAERKESSRSLAVDWTDHETWSRPPPKAGEPCADNEASWGHRRGDAPGQHDEAFYGYYLSAATMVPEEAGPAVPELVRRISLSACRRDPVPAFVAVLRRLRETGVNLGDALADSGYSHRVAEHWATPLRAMGASLVMDLHPTDRGPKGTHGGAILANGCLYCPATPPKLLELCPPGPSASSEAIASSDALAAEAGRYRLGRIGADDPDGYHRLSCPAVANKCRCPARPSSMALALELPTVKPPEQRPACCTQLTMTVPPSVNAKTAQKHPYPAQAWRASYARRAGAERSNATLKDPATNDISRGYCRLMGLAPILLFITATVLARNLRIEDAYAARMATDARRAAAGRAPKTRKRRRKSLAELSSAAAANAPP